MRNTLGLWVLWLALGVAAWAQQGPKVLVLPMEIRGTESPVDAESSTTLLESRFRQLAPQASIQVSRPADISIYGYQVGADQPPGPELAEKLCRAYGVQHLCWVSLRFQPDYESSKGSLALAGAARFWSYSSEKRRVEFDLPLSLARAGHVDGQVGDKDLQREVAVLAQGCIGDLAYQIVGAARHLAGLNPTIGSAAPSTGTDKIRRSKNYQAMAAATASYQKASKNQSLVDITTSQAAMQRAWVALSPQERAAIEDDFPGVAAAVQQVPVYQYGGLYYRR